VLCLDVNGGRRNRAGPNNPAARRARHRCGFVITMIGHEASLTLQTIWHADEEPLTTTKRLLAYLTAGLPDDGPPSFWIACMNPKRRPICRVRINFGVLVATQVFPRDVFRVALLAEARSIACLRTAEREIKPTPADGRLLYTIHETSKLLGIEFADYLIARCGDHDFYSWHCTDRPRD
jgi:DNA repair protein RadC